MSEKKERVLGNEHKLKSIKKDRSYFQKLDNKETPEKSEAHIIDLKKIKNEPRSPVVEETPIFLPIGGKAVA